jgi:HD-GYP domain-containing protein (c-di-GMP phosphodiesterase class II)
MNYIPIPIAMLEVGKPLPVNVVSDTGQLLLRKGQPIVSAQHRDKLHGFNASTSPGDALAWQRAYERMVHELLRSGMDLQAIAQMPMPSDIRESDYVEGQQLHGGWLDLQEVLRGILYQGGLAIQPLQRFMGIEKKLATLLHKDVDAGLYALFQALADDSLGYCATHALLCACVADLTAQKLGLSDLQRQSMRGAALGMNIGMAREQDSMARQASPINDWQRTLIKEHPQKSVDILTAFGVDDVDLLDMVRWHHAPNAVEALAHNTGSRRILAMADGFVARMAARKTRSAQTSMKAVKSIVLEAQGDALGLGSAMAQAVGFYPPGSYVLLENGETAVCVQRGQRANTPWVAPIIDKAGMPLGSYVPKDTSKTEFAIAHPVSFEKIKVAVSADKVKRLRERIPG